MTTFGYGTDDDDDEEEEDYGDAHCLYQYSVIRSRNFAFFIFSLNKLSKKTVNFYNFTNNLIKS